jgi:hypothetical protein
MIQGFEDGSLIEMPKGCLATIIETCMNGMYSEE